MLYIAPFSCRDMWDSCDVDWRDYDVTVPNTWPFTASRRIVSVLRHQAPLRSNRHAAPMDRGGWKPVRDLAAAVRLSIDDTISLLYAMSKDPKDRCQLAMLYRKTETPSGTKWVNEGVAQVRACQGHSIPWIVLDRLGVSITANKVKELPCLCHGISKANVSPCLPKWTLPGDP